MTRCRQLGVALALVSTALTSSALASEPTVTTTPPTLIAGETREATIDVVGVPGDSVLETAVNIGTVLQAAGAGKQVRLRYQLPPQKFPQRVCLLLWRSGMKQPIVVRFPLLGRTTMPIRTRPRSQVTITVGGRVFGPKSSGRTGRLSMTFLVAPGIAEGRAVTIDRRGLRNEKSLRIARPPYNQVALQVRALPSNKAGSSYQIAVATADPPKAKVWVEAGTTRPAGGSSALPLALAGRDLWVTSFFARRQKKPTTWELRASISGYARSQQTHSFELPALPPPPPKPPLVVERVAPPKPRGSWPKVILWSGVGVTASLLVAGIVTGQVASNQSAEYNDPKTTIDRRRSLDASASKLSTASIACFAVGGAVGVATALYYWLGYRRPSERRAVSLYGTHLVARW